MKTSRFQLIFLTTLVIFIIAGVIAFATYKTGSSKNQLSPITVWGTFPKDVFDQYVTQINYGLTQQMTVNYVQETPQSFSRDFVAALARGVGPDAILIPADLLLTSADKLTPIPYSVLPQRTFVNTFVDGASVYLSQDGELGIPFVADPLVMYWNRDMFNSAGIVGPNKRLWEITDGEWAKTFAVNVNGTFNLCRAFAPGMKERGWGRIVNFASMAGKEGNPNMSAYSAAKAAVIALTKSLGKELASSGVLVNVIAPAVIDTPMNAATAPEVLEHITSLIPMKRVGRPEEVAELIAWLTSDKLSFSTGAVYDISGGRATY